MTAVYSSPVLCTAEQNLPGFCTVRTAQPNLIKNDRRVQQSCVMYSTVEQNLLGFGTVQTAQYARTDKFQFGSKI